MVEYFSKTVVLVLTQDKDPATVAEAFIRKVLTRYGAPAEVVTDRGGEFEGAFQERPGPMQPWSTTGPLQRTTCRQTG
jgi:transposase-like protein